MSKQEQKKLSELSKKELFLFNLKKRALFYTGYLFIYIFPIAIVMSKFHLFSIVKHTHTLDLTVVFLGLFYLIFLAKFLKKKILTLKPGAFKSFLVGLLSLIPMIILACFIQIIQDLINNMPTIDISKYLWLIIESIGLGLVLQIVDSAFNKQYLYDLEIVKLAQKEADIETLKEELITKGIEYEK